MSICRAHNAPPSEWESSPEHRAMCEAQTLAEVLSGYQRRGHTWNRKQLDFARDLTDRLYAGMIAVIERGERKVIG